MVTTPSGGSCGEPGLTSSRCDRLLRIALVISILGFAVHIPAQGSSQPAEKSKEKPYALVAGTVWGPDDRPVYGVKVKIRRSEEKKAKWEQFSDHRGEFAQRVPAGQADYVVWVDLKGYKSPVYKNLRPGTEVTVHIQNEERQDVGLHLSQ